MALQDILKRILDEATAEVRRIETDTANEKKLLAEESARLEREDFEKLQVRTKEVLHSAEQKMMSLARGDNAKSLLSVKQNLIHQAMERFLSFLEKADDKTYAQLLEKLFESLPSPSGRVFAPPKRLEITSRVAPPGFDVVAHKDIENGFVVRIGKAEIDNSFRTLIFSEFRDQLVSYFAEQLKLV